LILKEENTRSKTVPITEKVLEFAKEKGLFECGIIVVGLSGGPDSVALLCILKKLHEQKAIDTDIVALHCNHHLRTGVCDDEALQVKQLCKRLGIEVKIIDFDCSGFAKQNHVSEETAGRILRYEAFEQYAQALEKTRRKTVRIAIAHHRDDIAETMMMNLFRGTGLEGLVNPKCLAGRLIRPLLCVNKSELVGFLESNNIKYATDQTNLTTVGTRNKWRNEFLPGIGSFYSEDPAVPLTRTYNLLSDDLDFINKASGEAYSGARIYLAGYPVIAVSKARMLHKALRSRLIRMLWLETFGDLIDFEEGHLKDCYALIGDDIQGEVTLDMPFGRKAYRHGDLFGFVMHDGAGALACRIAEDMGFITAGGAVKITVRDRDLNVGNSVSAAVSDSPYILEARIIENESELEYNNYSWFCPCSKAEGDGIVFGNINGIGNGCRMRKAGSAGSKELKRLMTDLKIPESARKQIIFAECCGEVLWLPGYGHGTGFTNNVSRGKYIADLQCGGGEPDALIRFTIGRQ